MKQDILKIAGVKDEKSFYKKFPSEEAFMKIHGKEFKKAKMGAAMVKKQLTQLTDFSNPPQAQVGTYIGGEQAPSYNPANYTDLYDQSDYAITGTNRQMRMQNANLAAQQDIAANSKKKGGLDIANLMQSAGTIAEMADSMRRGGYIPKAQGGAYIPPPTNYNQADTDITQQFNKENSANVGGVGVGKKQGFLAPVGGLTGSIPIVGDLVEGFQELQAEKDLQKQAHQFYEVSNLTKQATSLKPDIANRIYDRPEDRQFDPNQMGNPTGTGFNVLKNGAEIQNTYDPNDIYTDGGYEPLSDSEVIEQYRGGGFIKKAQLGDSIKGGLGKLDASGIGSKQFGQAGNALGSFIGGGHGKPNAGGRIGSTIGDTVGKFIPIPGASQALSFIGGTVGGIFGGKSAAKTEKWQNSGQQNLQDSAVMSGMQTVRNRNSSVMENGGWMNPEYNPQVITKFGDHGVNDLFSPDPMMDTLRAGGSISSSPYRQPSERAMQTFAMGGDLKIDGRGDIDFLAYNPETAKRGISGEIGISRGPSHDDGGFNIDFGGNKVEIEGGETILQNGGSVDDDPALNVLGDMYAGDFANNAIEGVNPKTLSSILKNRNLKDVKFKHLGNDIAKRTKRLNDLESKNTNIINASNMDDPFEILAAKTAKVMNDGINMQYKDLDKMQNGLMNVQNSYHEAAKEHGYDDTPKFLADVKKGKLKQYNPEAIDNSQYARNGIQIAKNGIQIAQDGKKVHSNRYDILKNAKVTKDKSGNTTIKYSDGESDEESVTFYTNGRVKYIDTDGKMTMRDLQDNDIVDIQKTLGNGYYAITSSGKSELFYNNGRSIVFSSDGKKEKRYTNYDDDSYDIDKPPTPKSTTTNKTNTSTKPVPATNNPNSNSSSKRSLAEKFDTVKEKALKKAQALYPGKKVEVREMSGDRDIDTQAGLRASGASRTDVSIHNLGGAKDFGIFVDGEFITDPSVYKKTTHAAAKEAGLYALNWQKDPFHISAIQEGGKNTYANLIKQYPEVKNSPQYQKTLRVLNRKGAEGDWTPTEKRAYEQLTRKDYSGLKTVDRDYTKIAPLYPNSPYEFDVPTVPQRPGLPIAPIDYERPRDVPVIKGTPPTTPIITVPGVPQKPKGPGFLNSLIPYLKPTDQEALDPNQLYPEMASLAMNNLEPVQAQLYNPQLETPYSVSLQDQLNANQADFNAIQRQVGYNPAAAASLAAQKYTANSSVLGQQERLNTAAKMEAYNRNRATLNDAQIKNLGILDTQYQRQSQAKSNTKEQALTALNSISSKIAQNKLENRRLGINENLYNYRYDKNGRAINYNAPANFQTDNLVANSDSDLIPITDETGKTTELRRIPKAKNDKSKIARNGSIVKAFKQF